MRQIGVKNPNVVQGVLSTEFDEKVKHNSKSARCVLRSFLVYFVASNTAQSRCKYWKALPQFQGLISDEHNTSRLIVFDFFNSTSNECHQQSLFVEN